MMGVRTPEYSSMVQMSTPLGATQVADFVLEPIAIALTHGLHRYKGKRSALILDCGHHAFRTYLLDMDGPSLSVAASTSDVACGSGAINDLVLDYCIREFRRQHPNWSKSPPSGDAFEAKRYQRPLFGDALDNALKPES